MNGIRGALRHPNFDDRVNELSAEFPRAREVVDGAIWELERDPSLGQWIPELDVWQLRLFRPPFLLMYSFSPRFVFFLTLLVAD
jgi:hypothetical protein